VAEVIGLGAAQSLPGPPLKPRSGRLGRAIL